MNELQYHDSRIAMLLDAFEAVKVAHENQKKSIYEKRGNDIDAFIAEDRAYYDVLASINALLTDTYGARDQFIRANKKLPDSEFIFKS